MIFTYKDTKNNRDYQIFFRIFYPELGYWLDSAGITKPITFHCSRHTFATMMLTLGADIYTVSKLLGHTKVETTQIYAKIINKKKDDAVSLIDAAFA